MIAYKFDDDDAKRLPPFGSTLIVDQVRSRESLLTYNQEINILTCRCRPGSIKELHSIDFNFGVHISDEVDHFLLSYFKGFNQLTILLIFEKRTVYRRGGRD